MGRVTTKEASMSKSASEDEWQAVVSVLSDGKMNHVTIRTEGGGKSAALAGAMLLTKFLTESRLTYFRVTPEADSFADFTTNRTYHRGYARFSVMDEPGPHTLPSAAIEPLRFGKCDEH
jgi:hypothetical protein